MVAFLSETTQTIGFICPFDDSTPNNGTSPVLMWVLLGVASVVIILWILIAVRKCSNRKHQRNPIPAFIRIVKNENFPVMLFKQLNIKDEEACTICQQKFLEDDEVRILECKHIYHKSCIDEWLQAHQFCCICKKNFNPLDLFQGFPISASIAVPEMTELQRDNWVDNK